MSIVIRIILFSILIFGILSGFSLKIDNAFKMRKVITNAIHNRNMVLIKNNEFDKRYEVDYSDMEPYDRTLWRLWDWSYKHILPNDKLKLIEEYIYE